LQEQDPSAVDASPNLTTMGILELETELLRIILEYVVSEPEKPISLEKRAYLSDNTVFAKRPQTTGRDSKSRARCTTCEEVQLHGTVLLC
jgi:hypothetical protein